MVKFVEDLMALPSKISSRADTIYIQQQYAFALNRSVFYPPHTPTHHLVLTPMCIYHLVLNPTCTHLSS